MIGPHLSNRASATPPVRSLKETASHGSSGFRGRGPLSTDLRMKRSRRWEIIGLTVSMQRDSRDGTSGGVDCLATRLV
jgi:hypothetical protein